MWSATSAAPRGSSPSEARLFARRYVPEASMTARAGCSTISPAPSRMRSTNGVSARFADRVRSIPSRVTASTVTPVRIRVRMAPNAASGSRYSCTSSAPFGARSRFPRFGPSRRFEQAASRRVDEVPPRREQANVPPRPHVGGDDISCFEHDEVQTALGQVRSGRETNGSCPDDGDRQSGETVLSDDGRLDVEQRQ